MITPERPYVEEVEAADETPADAGESHVKHMRNFIQAVHTRRQPVQDAEAGHHAASGAHMVNLSIRRKTRLEWDFEKDTVRI